jgi:hypothetical protein
MNTLLSSKKWPNIQKRKFKKNRMPFLITYTALKALFQKKEKNKKEDIAKLEIRKEERREK